MLVFLFTAPAPAAIYTLSLHDALPISDAGASPRGDRPGRWKAGPTVGVGIRDRKSTRLNSSHRTISYAVFCLKKKTETGYMASASGMCACCRSRTLPVLDGAVS